MSLLSLLGAAPLALLGITTDRARLTWAALLVVGYAVGSTALLARRRQPRQDLEARPTSGAGESIGSVESSVLVVFASQTGTGAELAETAAAMLREGGLPARVVDIAQVTREVLARVPIVLFVASTTGEGDAPDHAEPFVRAVMTEPGAFGQLRFGVLALGDRTYQEYCAFGRAIDGWLRESGATPLFNAVEVDGDDPVALEAWAGHLRALCGNADLIWRAATFERWPLRHQAWINEGSPGGPVFHLSLEAPSGSTWRAGDIAVVMLEQPIEAVRHLLERLQIAPETRVRDEGVEVTIAQALSRRQLLTDEATIEILRAQPAEALLAAMPVLPSREYSIASIPDSGRLDLLVRQVKTPEGRLGVGSGWLTSHARVGDGVLVRVRQNPSFRGPEADVPVILIGNGTGMAGLRAHLAERAAAGRRCWLIFGERCSQHDFHFRRDIEAWQAAGILERVDVAFSRDPGDGRYVQDLVRGIGDTLKSWVDDGAAIYVCGSLAGMAPGVHQALIDVLGEPSLIALQADGRYRRDVY